MIALARLSLRRPVLALLAWTALAVAFGAVGFGVAHQLSPSILVVHAVRRDVLGLARVARTPAGAGASA